MTIAKDLALFLYAIAPKPVCTMPHIGNASNWVAPFSAGNIFRPWRKDGSPRPKDGGFKWLRQYRQIYGAFLTLAANLPRLGTIG